MINSGQFKTGHKSKTRKGCLNKYYKGVYGVCEVCKNEYYIIPCKIDKSRFCSKICHNKYNEKTYEERFGKEKTVELLNKKSKSMKLLGLKLSKSHIEKIRNRMKNGGGLKARNSVKTFKNTKIELLMEKELKNRSIYFEREKKILGHFVDFWLPDYNIIIECNGNYWHGIEKQMIKDFYLSLNYYDFGYKVCQFYEDEIKTNVSECVERAIQ